MGLGFAQDLSPAANTGVQALGRLHATEAVAVEVSARTRLSTEPTTGLDEVLVFMAADNGSERFAKPVTVEPLAFSALADWGFGAQPKRGAVTGGVHLLGGLDVRLANDYLATLNPAADGSNPEELIVLSKPTWRVIGGVVAGFALHAALGERVTVRMTLVDHLAYERARAWSTAGGLGDVRLTSAVGTTIDVLVGF